MVKKEIKEKILKVIGYLMIMAITILISSWAISYLVQKDNIECPRCKCNVWDWSEGFESGEQAGYREGYHQAGEDALKLVKCYQTEEPKIEDCLQVFLLEDYEILPHLNPNQ